MKATTEGLVSFLDGTPARPPMGQPGPQHRKDDRPTSVAAAEAQAPGLSPKRLAVLRGLIEADRTGSGGGATAYELMLHLAYSGHAPAQNIVVKNLGDLRAMGLAFETGDTRPGSSAHHLIVFRPTDLGRIKAIDTQETP